MSEIANLKNLRVPKASHKTLPGRSVRKAQTEKTVHTISVENAKKGETIDFGTVLNEGEKSAPIRQRYMGGRPVLTAKASQDKKADVPVEEQIEQLGQIRKSAVEYESFFVDHLVKQMRQSPLAKTPGGDTFSDIAEQPFRDFLSQAGGLGLADTIVQQVARQEGLEQTLHEYPGIMGSNWRPDIAPNMLKKWTGTLQMAPENKGSQASESPVEAIGENHDDQGRIEAESAKKSDPDPAEARRTGLMDDEEIAWLYREAAEALA